MEDNNKVGNLLNDPKKAMLVMAAPLIVSSLVMEIQILLDTFWCSNLGSDAISAIAICTPIYHITLGIGTGISIGASAAIAKSLGAGKKDDADGIMGQTVVIVALTAIVSLFVMYAVRLPLIEFSGGGNNVEMCLEYMMPIMLCAFPLMMHDIFVETLRSEGDSKRGMALSLVAAILNAVFDPIFIFVFDFGVTGAAVATCMAYILTTLTGFFWYLSGRTYVIIRIPKGFFDRNSMSQISVIGLPCIIEFVLAPMIIIPQQALVVSCGGTDGLSIYSTTFLVISLAIIPMIALASTLIPVVSAQFGAGETDKIGFTCRYTIKTVLILDVIAASAVFISADFIADLYANSESMVALKGMFAEALRIYCIYLFIYSILRIGSAMLKALRYAKTATALTFIREFLCIGIFAIASKFTMTEIFWSVDISNLLILILGFIICMRVFRRSGVKLVTTY